MVQTFNPFVLFMRIFRGVHNMKLLLIQNNTENITSAHQSGAAVKTLLSVHPKMSRTYTECSIRTEWTHFHVGIIYEHNWTCKIAITCMNKKSGYVPDNNLWNLTGKIVKIRINRWTPTVQTSRPSNVFHTLWETCQTPCHTCREILKYIFKFQSYCWVLRIRLTFIFDSNVQHRNKYWYLMAAVSIFFLYIIIARK